MCYNIHQMVGLQVLYVLHCYNVTSLLLDVLCVTMHQTGWSTSRYYVLHCYKVTSLSLDVLCVTIYVRWLIYRQVTICVTLP